MHHHRLGTVSESSRLRQAARCIGSNMWTGTIESIHIASAAEAATQSVDQAQAIPGVGLEGDRYAKRQGTFYKALPDFELTLIEAEAVEALKRDYGVYNNPGEASPKLGTRPAPPHQPGGPDIQNCRGEIC